MMNNEYTNNNYNNGQNMNNTYDNNGFSNNSNNSYTNNMNYNQPLNENNLSFNLTITREKEFAGSLIKFKIFIDNVEVGKIKNGETVTLRVQCGQHTISFNNTIKQTINIVSDTSVKVGVIAPNTFGIINNAVNDINNSQEIDKVIKSANGPLIFSLCCIVISIVLLMLTNYVISPVMYGISIGYASINMVSIKKYKQSLNDKYQKILSKTIISIIISIVGIIISGYFIIG